MAQSPFLQSLRDHVAVRRDSPRTTRTYLFWVKYFILSPDKKHPRDLRPADVERWLTHLATGRWVSKATQALALNSVVYFYNKHIGMPLGDLGGFRRAERQRKLPVGLSQADVARLPDQLRGTHRLMISLGYGCGLRRLELAESGHLDVPSLIRHSHQRASYSSLARRPHHSSTKQ